MLDLLNPLEIFSEETPVETTFRFGATGLGKTLDAGSSEDDVQPGASVEAPLWLVRPLVGRSMASIKLPAIYGERYQRKLNAGADCVSLKNMAPYFYEVGNKLNEMWERSPIFSDFLVRTFRSRYYELISKGLNSMTGEEVLLLCSKLSVEEQQLFEGGRISTVCFDSWLQMERPAAARLPKSRQTKKRPAEQAARQPTLKQAARV